MSEVRFRWRRRWSAPSCVSTVLRVVVFDMARSDVRLVSVETRGKVM